MERTITCINCPVGCRMTAVLSEEGKFISVEGNTCPRGAVYARQECTLPERMVTAVIHVGGSNVPLSVKTSRPVPKSLVFPIMQELSGVKISVPVSEGQVVLENILGTGADIVSTRELR